MQFLGRNLSVAKPTLNALKLSEMLSKLFKFLPLACWKKIAIGPPSKKVDILAVKHGNS
jgi:hypothetical protein